MRLSALKSALSGAAVLVGLGSLPLAASAGFLLLPGAGSVLPGDAFDVTLRYEDAAPLDFGFQFDLSSSALGNLRLDSIGLPGASPVDGGLIGTGAALPATLSVPLSVTAALDVFAMPDWAAGVDLLTLSFTLDPGAAPGSALTLTAGNGLATIDFVDDVSWSAATSLRISAPTQNVPEGGTLVSVLIALAALGWVQRRRA
jgi:hypothetical protein